jgi:hypothetical protein
MHPRKFLLALSAAAACAFIPSAASAQWYGGSGIQFGFSSGYPNRGYYDNGYGSYYDNGYNGYNGYDGYYDNGRRWHDHDRWEHRRHRDHERWERHHDDDDD